MDRVQIVSIVASTFLLGVVIQLVRRRLLREAHAVSWLVFAAMLLTISLWRGTLDAIGLWLDVHYPPALLLLALILFVFVGSLYFSVVSSRLRDRVDALAQEVALLEARLRERERPPSGPDAPGA
jgi:uncharacterized protein DUF2304